MELKPESESRSDIENEYFEDNEREMISAFSDYFSDHLLSREDEIDMYYHYQIENQRLAAERNKRGFTKYRSIFIFSFLNVIMI